MDTPVYLVGYHSRQGTLINNYLAGKFHHSYVGQIDATETFLQHLSGEGNAVWFLSSNYFNREFFQKNNGHYTRFINRHQGQRIILFGDPINLLLLRTARQCRFDAIINLQDLLEHLDHTMGQLSNTSPYVSTSILFHAFRKAIPVKDEGNQMFFTSSPGKNNMVLEMLIIGCSRKHISNELGIPLRKLEDIIGKLRKRFHMKSTVGFVKLIPVDPVT